VVFNNIYLISFFLVVSLGFPIPALASPLWSASLPGSALYQTLKSSGDHPTRPRELAAGPLDLLMLGAMAAWLLFRVRNRRRENGLLQASYYQNPPRSVVGLRAVSYPSGIQGEKLLRFRDRWSEDFLRVQAAWNRRSLKAVRHLLSAELHRELDDELRRLSRENRENHLESVRVEQVDPVDSWEEGRTELVTVHFQGWKLDYTTESADGAWVEGSPEQPIKLDEFWTFARIFGPGELSAPWIVTSIQRGDRGSELPRMASLY
jgi:hypothetical protein